MRPDPREVYVNVKLCACLLQEGIVLDGRRLNVAVAITRDKAAKVKKSDTNKDLKDKRNLWLVREGSKLTNSICFTVL